MNVGQLRRVLGDLESIYRDSGDTKRANLLAKFSNLLDGEQEVPVARFAQRIGDSWQGALIQRSIRANVRGRRERAQIAK